MVKSLRYPVRITRRQQGAGVVGRRCGALGASPNSSGRSQFVGAVPVPDRIATLSSQGKAEIACETAQNGLGQFRLFREAATREYIVWWVKQLSQASQGTELFLSPFETRNQQLPGKE